MCTHAKHSGCVTLSDHIQKLNTILPGGIIKVPKELRRGKKQRQEKVRIY